jgi:hypothetical protein
MSQLLFLMSGFAIKGLGSLTNLIFIAIGLTPPIIPLISSIHVPSVNVRVFR